MPRRGLRKSTRKEHDSDNDMEVVEEDPVADIGEDAEVVVDDEEEDMLTESKEDELDEDEGDEVSLPVLHAGRFTIDHFVRPQDEEEEDAEEEDEEDEVVSSPAPETPNLPSRLRIKLKLPAHASGTSSMAQSVTGASTPTRSVRRRRKTRGSFVVVVHSEHCSLTRRCDSLQRWRLTLSRRILTMTTSPHDQHPQQLLPDDR